MTLEEIRTGQDVYYRPLHHVGRPVGGFVVKVGPRRVAVRLPHRRQIGIDLRGRPRWRRVWATVWVTADSLEPRSFPYERA